MHSKDDLIAAAKALAERRGVHKLDMREFRRELGIGPRPIYRHFGNWRNLCRAAGLEPKMWNRLITDEAIFAAMHEAFIACGGVGTRNEFERRFRYSGNVLVRRFGNWRNALSEFRAWSAANAPEFAYFDQLDERIAALPSIHMTKELLKPRPPWDSKGARLCGDPIGFRALAHAPVNEQGVILAFGAIAHDLGYAVEAVAAAFPDCFAKRRVGEGRWESVRIEFEFRSRNFRDHGHEPSGCDLIVCWEHDWPSCPLEVLELKSAIAAFKAAG